MDRMTIVVRSVAQIVIVAALLYFALLVTDALHYRSGLNVLWMVGIPFAVAWAFAKSPRRESAWLLAGLCLLLWAWFAMGLIAVLFGFGP